MCGALALLLTTATLRGEPFCVDHATVPRNTKCAGHLGFSSRLDLARQSRTYLE